MRDWIDMKHDLYFLTRLRNLSMLYVLKFPSPQLIYSSKSLNLSYHKHATRNTGIHRLVSLPQSVETETIERMMKANELGVNVRNLIRRKN